MPSRRDYLLNKNKFGDSPAKTNSTSGRLFAENEVGQRRKKREGSRSRRDYIQEKQKARRQSQDLRLANRGQKSPDVIAKNIMSRPEHLRDVSSYGEALEKYTTPAQFQQQYTAPKLGQAKDISETEIAKGLPARTQAEFDLAQRTGQSGIDTAQAETERQRMVTESQLATEGQALEQAQQLQPSTVQQAEQGPQLEMIESELARLTEIANEAYATGDFERGQAAEAQMEELQSQRMTSLGGEPTQTELPAKGGGRVGMLGQKVKDSIKGANILKVQSGLGQMLDPKSMFSKLKWENAWKSSNLLTMQNLIDSLQRAFTEVQNDAKPEEAQASLNLILTDIKLSPGYAVISDWQDADNMSSNEQRAWGAGYDRYAHQGGYNEAGELAKQIVQMVGGNSGVGTGNILQQQSQ